MNGLWPPPLPGRGQVRFIGDTVGLPPRLAGSLEAEPCSRMVRVDQGWILALRAFDGLVSVVTADTLSA
jgi:hypothetical protein